MASQLEGIRWVLESRTANSILHFPDFYRANQFNMVASCTNFLSSAGVDIRIQRDWRLDRGSVLYFSDHHTALDGFALPLASPVHHDVRRVTFAPTALCLGWQFVKRNIPIYPKGSYRNLWFQNCGLWNRLVYFCTHRWGPFASRHAAVRAIVSSLELGSSVCLLPSGVVGQSNWRSGIGSVLQEVSASNRNGDSIFFAPVYLSWNPTKRSVLVDTPCLLSVQQLQEEISSSIQASNRNRESVTQWLQARYQARQWP